MKNALIAFLTIFCANAAQANSSKIEVSNLEFYEFSGSLEVCGTAIHQGGKKPLLVTVVDPDSPATYTALSSENGNWCVVTRSWSDQTKIIVTASTIDFSEKSAVVSK